MPSSSFFLLPTAEKQGKICSRGDPALIPFSLHKAGLISQLSNTWRLQQIPPGQTLATTAQDSPTARHCWGGTIACPRSIVPAELQPAGSLLWYGAERQREVRNARSNLSQGSKRGEKRMKSLITETDSSQKRNSVCTLHSKLMNIRQRPVAQGTPLHVLTKTSQGSAPSQVLEAGFSFGKKTHQGRSFPESARAVGQDLAEAPP